MYKIDNFMIGVVNKLLNFLNDYFGISQKIFERLLMVIIFGNQILELEKHYSLYVLIVDLALATVVLNQHRLPSTARCVYWQNPFIKIMRVCGTIYTFCIIVATIIVYGGPYDLSNINYTFIEVCAMLLFYSFGCNIDGERGKNGKMAWNKIKELFGTSWIAIPAGSKI